MRDVYNTCISILLRPSYLHMSCYCSDNKNNNTYYCTCVCLFKEVRRTKAYVELISFWNQRVTSIGFYLDVITFSFYLIQNFFITGATLFLFNRLYYYVGNSLDNMGEDISPKHSVLYQAHPIFISLYVWK